jgi:hypothetical protein
MLVVPPEADRLLIIPSRLAPDQQPDLFRP